MVLLLAQALPLAAQPAAPGGARFPLFIQEFAVDGVYSLRAVQVEAAVYPYLGPERTEADVRAACAALEKLYQDRGFGAATARFEGRIDPGGIVHLAVAEGTVGRVRVRGARYFSPEAIMRSAPSVAEGKVLNFNDLTRDVVALNQTRDRSVTPTLQPGVEPGTFDVVLDVKDNSPAHASAELNNHRSPNTTPLRLTASVSDSNLWQSGQGMGVSFELAPERRRDSEVATAYYLMRFAGLPRWSFLFQGTKQDSNISTLGGATVAGPGETAEFRASANLPTGKDWDTGRDWQNFSHSVSFAVDYKHFRQTVDPGGTDRAAILTTPITYEPFSFDYTATLRGLGGKDSATDFGAGVTLDFRGMGSGPNIFNLNRFGADGNFLIARAHLAHTQPLPLGLEAFARADGQLASQPLVSSEEFSGGGEASVRGYLESETVGDNGVSGTLELRSPRLLEGLGKAANWRLFAFADAADLSLLDPLPGQQASFSLASVGLGTRLAVADHLSGECDAALPLKAQAETRARAPRVTFSVGLNY